MGSVPKSLPRRVIPPGPPLSENFPTLSDLPPPGSVSEITAPNFFVPYQGCLPPQASHCLPPSTPLPGIKMSLRSPAAPRMPQRPSPSSPSAPPPRAAASSTPIPRPTDLWQGAFRSAPARGPEYRIGCTVGSLRRFDQYSSSGIAKVWRLTPLRSVLVKRDS